MAFQVSPGVNISEIDASSSVPAIVTSTGAMVGRFAKGPVSEIVDVSSEEQLLAIFGAPDDTNYKSWFTAANFLSYSSSLKVVRVVDGDNSTVNSRARNSLSGKVTASTSASGAEQSFVGVAETETTLYGSSAQEFSINTNGALTSVNLHSGVTTAVSGGTVNQHLHPRSTTALNSAISSQGYTIVDASSAITGTENTHHAVRTLTGADVSIFIRATGETTGGLLPASRYSIGAASTTTSGQDIQFADNIGNTSISGPYYVYHHGTTGKRLVTSGIAATDMTAGFTYPLYKRQSAANVADSGQYGGSGTSHVHYFTGYGGVADAETLSGNTLNLSANHGLSVGDPVVYTNSGTAITGLTANTVYYVASVSTNAVTLSASYDYASSTAGTVLTITGTTGASAVYLYNAFYMPSSTMNHSKSTAPVDAAIKPYASASDSMTIKVAQQSSFQMRSIPGAYAVNNNLIVSAQSAAGTVTDGGATDADVSHSVTDYSVTASNKTIVYSENLPRTGQTETVTVPAQKAFSLSPAVNVANGETVEVKVNDVVASVGSAVGQYVLSASGDVITFGGVGSDSGFAPAAGVSVKVNITSALSNSFVYDAATLLVSNNTSFENGTYFGNSSTTSGHEFMAKNPGVWGNNLHVYMIDESSYADFVSNEPSLAGNLSGVPRADDKTVDSDATVPAGTQDSEKPTQGISIIVTDVDRLGNTVVVEVMENMSKAGNGKSSSGKNLYYVDMINEGSSQVFVLNHPSTTGMDWGTNISTTPGSLKSSFAKLNQPTSTADGTENYISRPFGNGSDGVSPQAGHFTAGYDMFADPEVVDCSFLLQGESADLSAQPAGTIGHIIDVATSRKDCIACISPTEATVAADKVSGGVSNTLAFFRNVRKSNYAFADSNYKYIIDKFSNKYRFVPFNADTAGLMVRSELERDAWFSPAGFNRGVYKGVVKTMVDQTKSHRDALYQEAVNPVVNFAGQGTVLFGDKTFTSKPSAFDRINVRRLFIVLEKSIATAAKFTLFEFNDEFTRAQFTSLIEPFLRDIKGRRGIFDFKVVCDSTNNTANVIDTNQFVGDIFIQPARSINFIQLNFVAVRTGVSFDEIVGVV